MTYDKEKNEEVKELVLARLEIMPSDFRLSVGNKGTFTKQQLMEHVTKGDDVGRQVTEMQLKFIKALTTGKLIETLNKYG